MAVAVVSILVWYGVGISASTPKAGPGLVLDEGWTHLTFARNLAQRGIWSIQPERTTGGENSILWVLILAAGLKITSDGVLAGYVLNGILLVTLAWLVRRMWNPGVRGVLLFVLTLMAAANGNMIWHAFSGMETLLVLVLGVGAFHLASNSHYRWAAVLVFLSAMTRPEGFLVGVVVILWFRNAGGVLTLTAGLLGLVFSLLWNDHVTGTLLPNTMVGQRWLIGAGPDWDRTPLDILRNTGYLTGLWGYRFLQFTLGEAWFRSIGWGWFGGLLAVVGIAVTITGLWAYMSRLRPVTGCVLTWAAIQMVAYAVVLPSRGHAGRYQPVVLLLLVLLIGHGLAYLHSLREGKLPIGPEAAVVAGACLLSVFIWRNIVIDSVSHFDRIHVAAGRWIAQHTSKTARIAAFELGALSYFGDRPVIDIGGQVDPTAGWALYQNQTAEYMESRRADYLVMVFPYTDPEEYIRRAGLDRLANNGTLRLKEEFFLPVPKTYLPGEASQVVANKIRIYKLRWNKNP